MTAKAVFTMKLEPGLRDAFMAEAAAADRPAAQLIRELMRAYIEKSRASREYKEFMRRKAETARADISAGRVHASEEIEAALAARYEASQE
ncbi:MAG: antitoxin of toxin-antitoxin stability system [Azonexus sp.]|jgi:hypothetical protein|nr:antitoxin of toxin-antitoxin stability system [Azonexus sp.]